MKTRYLKRNFRVACFLLEIAILFLFSYTVEILRQKVGDAFVAEARKPKNDTVSNDCSVLLHCHCAII